MRTLNLLLLLSGAALAADLRIGIIGTDTSHVPAFTAILNDASNPEHIAGARVVAAYKGGSPDLEISRSRVDKFAEEVRTKWNVEIVPDIATLCKSVDVVLLESVDGRIHLEQARQVIAARKPLFIDKPLAASLEDAREIARLAKAAGVPVFSASSFRFGEIAAALKSPEATGATVWGPGPLEPLYPLDLAYYGIHSVEMLYTLLGPGCEAVSRVSTADTDELVGRWKNGRVGTVRLIRPYSEAGAVVFQPKKIVQSDPKMNQPYVALLREVVKFFKTGVSPVSIDETVEIIAFLDAAQRSQQAGGKLIPLR